MDDGHCIAVAFLARIDAVVVNAALTRVFVVGTGPKVAFDSVSIIPPRLDDAIQFKRCTETVILVAGDAPSLGD